MKKKIMKLMLVASLLLIPLLMSQATAHPPADMKLQYDIDTQILDVIITHNSPAPSFHYIERVEITVNDALVFAEDYTDQPTTTTFTYSYNITAVIDDVIEVTAICNINGNIVRSLTVTDAPSIRLFKPEKGIYIGNNKVIPFRSTIILGSIDIEVIAEDPDGIDRVEFFIDDVLQENDTAFPYSWTWSERAFLRKTIKVTAYDTAGKDASDELMVFKIL